MAKIGYNVQAQALSGSEKDALIDILKDMKPTTITVIDGKAYAARCARELPYCLVWHRMSNPLGLPERTDDNIHLHMSEVDFWRVATAGLEPLPNLGVYCNNEPEFTEELWTWHENVAALSIRDRRISGHANIGTGRPGDLTKIPLARKFIRLAIDSPYVYLHLHEYAICHPKHRDDLSKPEAGAPWTHWYMGRFTFWTDYAFAEYRRYPKIVVTEWGFDDPLYDAQFAGQFRAAAKWAQWGRFDMESYCYELLTDAYRALYKHPAIVGMCLFTYGYVQDGGGPDKQGRWRDFDYRRMPVFMRKLEGLMDDTPMPIPPVVEPAPAPIPGPGDGTVRRIAFAGRLNFRTGAGLSEAVLAVLDDGDVVTLTGHIDQGDGYTWVSVSHEGEDGWIALIKGLRLPDFESPPSPPAPLPEGEGSGKLPTPGIQVTMRLDGETYTGVLTRQ